MIFHQKKRKNFQKIDYQSNLLLTNGKNGSFFRNFLQNCINYAGITDYEKSFQEVASYLAKASHLANQLASWPVSYPANFPANRELTSQLAIQLTSYG